MCQKLLAISLEHISVDDTNNVVSTIYSSELKKLFNTDSGYLFTHIVEACQRKSGRPSLFDWQVLLLDERAKKLQAHAVVTDAMFEDGRLTIRYNNSLTDKIIDLKSNYTILSLAETMRMSSAYSLRLLEILKSRHDHETGRSKSQGAHRFYYDLIELKMELGIVDAEPYKKIREELAKPYPDYRKVEEMCIEEKCNRYPSYSDFKNRILSKIVKEINEKSMLSVEFSEVRERRKVVGIEFYVEKRIPEEKAPLRKRDKSEILDRVSDLTGRYLKTSEILDICEYADYDYERIKEAWNYLKGYKKEIENPVGFLKAAIRDGYENTELEIVDDIEIKLTKASL